VIRIAVAAALLAAALSQASAQSILDQKFPDFLGDAATKSAHPAPAASQDPIVLIQMQREAENACVMTPQAKYPLRFGDEPVCSAARRFEGQLVAAGYCRFGGSAG
jgi:hypothetical protein